MWRFARYWMSLILKTCRRPRKWILVSSIRLICPKMGRPKVLNRTFKNLFKTKKSQRTKNFHGTKNPSGTKNRSWRFSLNQKSRLRQSNLQSTLSLSKKRASQQRYLNLSHNRLQLLYQTGSQRKSWNRLSSRSRRHHSRRPRQ